MIPNKRATGTQKESLAVAFLTEEGMEVLDRNYYSKAGEIDIIAREGSYLVFIEVKYRKDLRYGDPLEAIGHQKQNRIRGGARAYLYAHHYAADTPVRFDVVSILDQQITHVRNAF